MIRRLGLFILAIALSSPIGSGRVVAAGAAITGSVQAGGAATPNAVVFIQQAQGTFPPTSAATIDQRSMKFAPAVLPVVVGTTVKFLNRDPTQHNVFTPDYEKYNLGTWPQGQTKDHLFAKCAKPPCAYVQLCRIHPEMEAYVVVLQNPFFATTDQTGHFRIDNVPPGSYSLAVWAPKGHAPAKPITVEAAPVTVDFSLTR